MTTNKKNNKKLLIVSSIVIFIIIFASFLLINQRNNIIKKIIISKLSEQGFNNASIENLDLTSDSLKLYNLKLSETINIGYIQASYNLSTNNLLTISNVTLDKVNFIYIENSSQTTINPIDALKEALSKNIPVENITIKMAKIIFPSESELPINKAKFRNIKIKINNIKNKVNIIGEVNFENDDINIYANFTASANSNGDINFSYEIEKGDLYLPNIKAKRLNGWGEFSHINNKINTQASINIGSASIIGIPFRGITLTYKDTPNRLLMINGHSIGNVARFALSLNLSKPDKNNTVLIEGKLDISAKKLETLSKIVGQNKTGFPLDDIFKKISGSTNILLNFKGQKLNSSITNFLTGWTKFEGGFSASLSNLTVKPYLKNTTATIQANLNPSDDGLTITPKNLNIKGKIYNKKFSLKTKDRKAYILINKGWKHTLIHMPALSLVYDGTTAMIEKGKINIYNGIGDGKLKAIITPENNLTTPIYTDIIFNYSKEKNIHFNIKAKDKTGIVSAKIIGDISAINNKGNITIEVPPINFSETSLQPNDLVPSLKNKLKNTNGIIGLNAEIIFPEKTTMSTLLIKNISTNYDGNLLKNLNATIKINSLFPPHIKNQTIAFESFDVGIPFYDGLVNFSYDDNQEKPLYIKDASWKMAGGTISTSNFRINPNNPDAQFDVEISDIALQQLFTLAPLDGLEATGVIGGTLPVSIKDGKIIIKDGNLNTKMKGKLSYAPKDLPAFLQDSSNQNIVYLRKALNNFHYDDLSFTINGTTGEKQAIKLYAKGRNPDFTEQRPIILNLNLEGALGNILTQQTKAYTIPDNISKQIKEYEGNNAKKD